jgi:hypothetical protein
MRRTRGAKRSPVATLIPSKQRNDDVLHRPGERFPRGPTAVVNWLRFPFFPDSLCCSDRESF